MGGHRPSSPGVPKILGPRLWVPAPPLWWPWVLPAPSPQKPQREGGWLPDGDGGTPFCLSREAGALVSGGLDTRVHRLGEEIRQEGRLWTLRLGGSEMCGSASVQAGCPPQLRAFSPFLGFVPQISLSSHLLLCLMPFRVWGIEPSCPALPCPLGSPRWSLPWGACFQKPCPASPRGDSRRPRAPLCECFGV